MTGTPAWVAPLAALAVSAAVVGGVVVQGARRASFALDQPNERSLHTKPVPRLGGLGIVAGSLTGWALSASSVSSALWIGVVLLGAVSLVDDLRGVPIGARFVAHVLASGVFCASLPHDGVARLLPFGFALLPVIAVGMVWVINLYNFMDGSDGLAGGMAVAGFGAYAAAAWLAGAAWLAVASACVAAASAGFLVFNFHPAKTFMGDIGSIPLGFLAAALGVAGWDQRVWPAWLPFVVFSPFLVDATVTLFARALRGEKVWRAHRSHYYQRLVLMGWGHRKVAFAEYALMAALDVSALAAVRVPGSGAVVLLLLGGWGVVYAVLLRAIDARWARFSAAAAPGGS